MDCISPKISEQQMRELDCPYTGAEIEATVKILGPNKASGIDDIHASFYQAYWEIVGDETVKVCLQILNGDADISPVNKTVIALIPKITNPLHMKDFRSISLCNVSYQISNI